jgi:undecaprenyl diphosphate synthase
LNSKIQAAKRLEIDPSNLPSHVAIIMDGNGRWAKQRLIKRINGHAQGAETVRTIVRASREIGISYLTLYAFSTENWQRPKAEIMALMGLLKRFLKSELEEMLENNIRLEAIGQIERLPDDVQKRLGETMAATRKNDGLVLTLALSYGSRAEIIRMVKHVACKAYARNIEPDKLTDIQLADIIADHLYTRHMPDPDLLIRTSGEMRISNFLLWQIAYTEIYVTQTLWPDFNKEEFLSIVAAYQHRERRFGKVYP